jgi:hypothetical protein
MFAEKAELHITAAAQLLLRRLISWHELAKSMVDTNISKGPACASEKLVPNYQCRLLVTVSGK